MSARGGADAVHPGVDLEVDGHGQPAAGGRAQAADEGLGVGGDHDTGGEGLVDVGRARLGQQQDRRRDAGGAQLRGLGHLGHGEPRGASLDRGPCHRHGTVAVAVGLHHRAHLGGSAHRAEGLDVGGDRVERHVRPRPRHQPRSSESALGSASTRSDATSPSAGTAGAGPGVQPGARRGGVERRDPPREEGADGAAEHVTRSGGGQASVAVGHDPHLAIRSGDHRGRALEEHDGAGLGREGPGGRQPVGFRPTAREPLVLAVVRGEHRRGASGGEPSDVPTQRGETVAVHDSRPVGAREHVEDGRLGGRRRCRAPDR